MFCIIFRFDYTALSGQNIFSGLTLADDIKQHQCFPKNQYPRSFEWVVQHLLGMANDASFLCPYLFPCSFLVAVPVIRVAITGMPEPAATFATFAVLAPLTEIITAQQRALVVPCAVGATVPLDQASTLGTGELAELARFFDRKADVVAHLVLKLHDPWVTLWVGKGKDSYYGGCQESEAAELHHVGSVFYVNTRYVSRQMLSLGREDCYEQDKHYKKAT